MFVAALVDASLEGELLGKNAYETRRLNEPGLQVRDRLAASGKYQVLDAPVAKELNSTLERVRYLYDCNAVCCYKLTSNFSD